VESAPSLPLTSALFWQTPTDYDSSSPPLRVYLSAHHSIQQPFPLSPLNTWKLYIFVRLNLPSSSTTHQRTFPRAPLPRGPQLPTTTTRKGARKLGHEMYPVAREHRAIKSGNPSSSPHPCHIVPTLQKKRHPVNPIAFLSLTVRLRELTTTQNYTSLYINTISPAPPSNVRHHTTAPNILINNMAAPNLSENLTTLVEHLEICPPWRTHRRNTSEIWKSRGPQHTLGNAGVPNRTMGYGKSLPSGTTCKTQLFPSALALRYPLDPRLHPIPYKRITIRLGTSKHTTSSIYAATTTINNKVSYENLQQLGPDPPRWLAHNTTTFPDRNQAITHTQTPQHTTESPLPHYTLQSPVSISTLPSSGEPQAAAAVAAAGAEILGAEAATTSAQVARAAIEAATAATNKHNTDTATHTRSEPPTQPTIATVDARAGTAETSKIPILPTPPSYTTDLPGSTIGDDQQPDDANLGLTKEDAPLWGSFLPGNKAQEDLKARKPKRRTQAREIKCNPKTNE